MKTSLWPVGFALLAVLPLAAAAAGSDHSPKPCFQVSVQNERVNDATVKQTCDWNFNRTVQAGAQNHAHTTQTGTVNNNTVRQYQYDVPAGFNRRHGGE